MPAPIYITVDSQRYINSITHRFEEELKKYQKLKEEKR
jgi:hypothetical protein